MTRTSIVLTGLAGLAGALLLTLVCLYVMGAGWIPALITRPAFVWGIFGFLLFFSIAEIPVMVVGMRRLAESSNPKAKVLVLITNTGYTFFAGVYAAPFILLTGQSTLQLIAGAFLGALSVVRFITAVIFLPHVQQS